QFAKIPGQETNALSTMSGRFVLNRRAEYSPPARGRSPLGPLPRLRIRDGDGRPQLEATRVLRVLRRDVDPGGQLAAVHQARRSEGHHERQWFAVSRRDLLAGP